VSQQLKQPFKLLQTFAMEVARASGDSYFRSNHAQFINSISPVRGEPPVPAIHQLPAWKIRVDDVAGGRISVGRSYGGDSCYSASWNVLGGVGDFGEQGCPGSTVGADALECSQCSRDIREYCRITGTRRRCRCKVAAKFTNHEKGNQVDRGSCA
jgi:hypothetical protein